jgi:DNA-binding MarR family transcriptional regulator
MHVEYLLGLTAKQKIILRAIAKGDGEGGFADMDQIMDRLGYAPSKQALQCSIRVLVKRGMAEKKGVELRRERMRQVIALTPKGYSFLAAALGHNSQENWGAEGIPLGAEG